MGESVMEATLTKWLKEVGESVDMDDIVVEIATDKVDSEVPSEVEGVLVESKKNKTSFRIPLVDVKRTVPDVSSL